jgi:precorrin-6B C5,15-methyltransferase / cobalt-precorrin-6B C5,C15-methyltransferase
VSEALEAGEPWLSVVGIGDDGLASLSPAARALIEAGEVLVGGERHLAKLPRHPATRLAWRRPLAATLDEIAAHRGRRVVVLASGDPMCCGVGELLHRHFPPGELRVVPAPSAFSLACARLGWPRTEIETLSLHGRPLELVHRWLWPGARLIALSRDGATPGKVAALLVARGFGPSRMWAFAHMGGQRETRIEGSAEGWPGAACPDLNTLAIECAAGPGARVLSPVPGLPDEAFASDGMLTKREVRAATLARLEPLPGQLLWDVGAGSGSVAIEWLRAARRARAVAIEREAARCARIATNALDLGVPELEVVQGAAPAALAGLAPPDAVFIGGGVTNPGLLEACWQALRPGGRLVANAVTLEAEAMLLEAAERWGGELARIAIARAVPVGRFRSWRPLMPVTQLALKKP